MVTESVLSAWRATQPWVGLLAGVLALIDWTLHVRRFREGRALTEQVRSHIWHFVFGETLRALRLPLLLGAFSSLYRATWVSSLPTVVVLGLAYGCVDFVIYWWHRVLHETDLGWASHSVHHTAERFEVSLGARLGLLQRAVDDVIYAPLALLGFSPAVLVVAIEVNRLAQYWTHTEHIGRIPWLDWWVNTPATHRLHHQLMRGGPRKNYGSNLLVWDHLFGTYQSPADERVAYGVVGMPDTRRFLSTQLQGVTALWRDAVQSEAQRLVAVVFSMFFVVWVVVYGVVFGASIFLWLCCLCNILLLWVVWSKENRLLSVVAVLMLGVQGCYGIDFIGHLTLGRGPWGVTDYVFDERRALGVRLLSMYHLAVPVLLLWLLSKRGYWTGAWLPAVTLFGGVFFASLLWVVGHPEPLAREDQINFVLGLSGESPWAVALGFPLVFVIPTSLVLSAMKTLKVMPSPS